jgi:hypothetical protein
VLPAAQVDHLLLQTIEKSSSVNPVLIRTATAWHTCVWNTYPVNETFNFDFFACILNTLLLILASILQYASFHHAPKKGCWRMIWIDSIAFK